MKNKSKSIIFSKRKIKGLGLFENIYLKFVGYIDGAKGLPCENTDGNWTSPHLNRELHSYDEFTSYVWGCLQIEKKEDYVRLGELIDSLTHTKSQLEILEMNLASALSEEKEVPFIRKQGENKLTDAQVAARRRNEKSRRLAGLKSHISNLQNKFLGEIDEFSALRNQIIEDNNSTRLLCNKVKDHLLQRLDVYWNAALAKHPQSERMPVVPSLEVCSQSENIYMEPHKILMQKGEFISRSKGEKETM